MKTASPFAFPLEYWHEDIGPVLWWHPGETPYVGTPLDRGQDLEIMIGLTTFHKRGVIGGWPGYHKLWTHLPPIPENVDKDT